MAPRDAAFEDLLADVMENPERVLDPELSSDQVLELQKAMNPYSYVADGAGDGETAKAVAASYTNLRADYLKRFAMTSLVGFVFRMAGEWEPPAAARRWTPAAAEAPAPWAPAALLERAEALQALAHAAAEAAAEATAATAAAASAAAALAEATVAGGAGAGALAALAAAESAALEAADGALAKSRGMQYAAMTELRTLGAASAARLPAFAAEARQHPELRGEIDADLARGGGGQAEMPAAQAKALVASFLRAHFEFNPDAHVRSAYDEVVTAPAEVEGLGAVAADPADPARLPLEAVRGARPEFASAADKEAFEALTESPRAYNAAAFMLRHGPAARALGAALAAPERFGRYLFPVAPDAPARAAVEAIPPQDTFHRWAYFEEVNYEALRGAVEAIYHDKPDLDWALILYEHFEGTRAEVDEAFAAFRDKHQDEVISDLRLLDVGGWTLLGDFKENRDKIDFYNKHTDILKRILDRHAEDKKLGQDLMRNRVRQTKAKNIRADGPDAPGLAEYKTQNAGKSLGGQGGEEVISREEMFRLERARGDLRAAQELKVLDQCRQTIDELSTAAKVRELRPDEETRLKNAQTDIVRAREMIEVPADAIQVDVWTHDTKAGDFGKSKFFTKASAPEHIAELQREQAGASGLRPAAAPAAAIPAAAETTTAADLAPFAQHDLAREVAGSRLAEAAGKSGKEEA